MDIRTFRDGKVVIKEQGVEATVSPTDHPNVKVWDAENRYAYFTNHGGQLGEKPSMGLRVHVAKLELKFYFTVRGTKTNWTENDEWLQAWQVKRDIITDNQASIALRMGA